MANASQSAPKTIFTVSSRAQEQDPETTGARSDGELARPSAPSEGVSERSEQETQASASAVPAASASNQSVMDKIGRAHV